MLLFTGGIDLWALEDEKTSFSLVSSALEHDDMTSSVSTNSDKSNFLSASYDHTCVNIDFFINLGCSFTVNGESLLWRSNALNFNFYG